MDTTKNTNNNLETTHHIPMSLTSSSQASKRTHEEICFKKLEKPSNDQKPEANEKVVEETGRDKLKRHRVEMSGRVWIPDIWGQEDLLKKWIDCTVFDSGLERSNIMSARDALIQEGRSSLSLSIENSC